MAQTDSVIVVAPASMVSGVALAMLAAIGFSAKAIFIKLAYRYGVDAVTLLALRMGFAVPVFLAVAGWSGRNGNRQALDRQEWGAVVVLGLLGYYLSSLLDFRGLEYISAGLERLILFLYPTVVVLLSALLFRQKITARQVVALLLSYAGIALVFLQDIGSLHAGLGLGAALVFGSTLTYSLYLIGAGRYIRRIGSVRFTAYAMTVASAATFAQFVLTHPLQALGQPAPVYRLAVAMAVMSTILPVFMLSSAIHRLGAGHTALAGAVGPVATLVLAYWFLGEQIGALQMTGSALVLLGVLVITLAKNK